MRHIFTLIVMFSVAFSATSQQINPVPDYIFRNQLSVGRNAATDTSAYFSIGPRYGANKGVMLPMVVDTNAVTGNKRNGLLIFSIQRNNFVYWDSVGTKWTAITPTGVDTLIVSTRAWRKKGDDSLLAIINSMSGTVTSVTAGNGLTGGTITTTGTIKADTLLLSTKAYRQKAVDSLIQLISFLGGGTVLSVQAGTGMNFTTITTSGAVNADTTVLSTRLNRNKARDSVVSLLPSKLNISDTATMLSPYYRTVQANAALANKLNISDTSTMLNPYLRKSDTASMLSSYIKDPGYALKKSSKSLAVDTLIMATRPRVQKGLDSIASLIVPVINDTLLLSTRAWRQKGDDSVSALINAKANASGTTNYLSKFTNSNTLGNSIVYATGSEVGISTPSPTHPLDVNGRARIRTIDSTFSAINMLYADINGVIKKASIPSTSVDSAIYSTKAWRQKAVDSLQSNISLKVNAADTGTMLNPYVRSSGTNTYIPKFNPNSRNLVNSAMYDSAGYLRVYSNNINNIQNHSQQDPAVKMSVVKDGILGYGFMLQQNDSSTTGSQLVALFRKGLLTSDTIRNGYGVGVEFSTQDNERVWRRSSFITSRTVDSARFAYKTELEFMVQNTGVFVRGLRVRPDSTIRILGLAGTGTRNVVADSNGDLRIGSGGGEVDSLIYSTRAWRQKGIDSVVSLLGGGGGGSGTVTSVSAGTGMNFSTITTTGSVSADTIILSTRARTKKQIDSVAALVSGVTMSEGTVTIESGWNFSRPTGSTGPTSQVVKVTDGSLTTVFVNIAVHKTTATFTEDAWIKVGTLPSGYRPNNVIMGQLPTIVSGNQFNSQSNVTFTGDMKTSGHMAFRIQEDGDIEINVDQVTSSVDLSGANYVLFPIVVSFPIIAVIN